MALILLAEDDEGIRVPLVRALEREGYEVDAVATGTDAVMSGVDGEHDLLILDIGLPGVDGLEVCQRVREGRPAVPIVFLTAQDGEMDAVSGLDAGADDYITKPFRLAELMARVRSQLRRTTAEQFQAADVSVDVAARKAWQGDEELELSPKEFDLLALLRPRGGPGRDAGAHHGRGVGRELVRIDEDARHARLVAAAEARRRRRRSEAAGDRPRRRTAL